MQLTEKQLRIQDRADKTLSFGCLIKEDSIAFIVSSIDKEKSGLITILRNGVLLVATEQMIELNKTIEIIGHPMTRGRLCYLYKEAMKKKVDVRIINPLTNIEDFLDRNHITYQQTVLERPEELQDLVLSFLGTL